MKFAFLGTKLRCIAVALGLGLLLAGCAGQETVPTETAIFADPVGSSDTENNEYTPTMPIPTQTVPESAKTPTPTPTPTDPASMKTEPENSTTVSEDGIYCGVTNASDVTKDECLKPGAQVYCFEDPQGKREFFAIENPAGTDDFPIQNGLKIGGKYHLTVKDEKVIVGAVAVAEEPLSKEQIALCGNLLSNQDSVNSRTLRGLLVNAMKPMGKTLYVFGGGWNFQDTGGADAARTPGLSEDWLRFFCENDASYDHRGEMEFGRLYPSGGFNEYSFAGLDCSGYVGWTVYNTMNDCACAEGEDYVTTSTLLAKSLADKGLGTFRRPVGEAAEAIAQSLLPGDVVSMKGHVYLVVGRCEDGSILFAHSNHATSVTGADGGGVSLGALNPGADRSADCDAYRLACTVMEENWPEWVKRYPVQMKSVSNYLTFVREDETTGIFSWDTTQALSDPEQVRTKSAEEMIELIFSEKMQEEDRSK